MKKILSAAALLAIAACVVTWLLQDRDEQALLAQISSARQSRTAADADSQDCRKRLIALENVSASSLRMPAADPKKTPEERAMDLHRFRTTVVSDWFDRRYARFCRGAGLSESQSVKLRQVMVDHWVRWCDVVDAAYANGVTSPTDAVFRTMGAQEWGQYKAELAGVLGTNGPQQIAAYDRTMAMQSLVDDTAGLVYSSDSPLTTSQADALAKILSANSAQYAKGGPARISDLNVAAVASQATVILAPSQLQALELAITSAQSGTGLLPAIAAAQHPPAAK